MNKTNLPNNLYEIRRNASLSHEEFAEKLGVSRQAVSKWERGEAYPDTENLITISEMFGVTLDELLKGENLSAHYTDFSANDRENESETEPKKQGFGVRVEIGDNVSFHAGKGNEDDFDIDEDDSDIDEDDGSEDEEARKSWRFSVLYSVPYPIICAVAFLILGFACDAWGWAWTLFMTIPIYYSILDAVRKKRFTSFAYPVFAAFLYCLFGMLFSWWHPGWIIFISIPVYYPIAEAIDRHTANKNRN